MESWRVAVAVIGTFVLFVGVSAIFGSVDVLSVGFLLGGVSALSFAFIGCDDPYRLGLVVVITVVGSLLSNYVYNEVIFGDSVIVLRASDGSLVYVRPNVPFNLWYGSQDLGDSMDVFFKAGVLATEVSVKPDPVITWQMVLAITWYDDYGNVEIYDRMYDITTTEGVNFNWKQEGTYSWKAEVGTGGYPPVYITSITSNDPLWNPYQNPEGQFYPSYIDCNLAAVATASVNGLSVTSQGIQSAVWTVKNTIAGLRITDITPYIE